MIELSDLFNYYRKNYVWMDYRSWSLGITCDTYCFGEIILGVDNIIFISILVGVYLKANASLVVLLDLV